MIYSDATRIKQIIVFNLQNGTIWRDRKNVYTYRHDFGNLFIILFIFIVIYEIYVMYFCYHQ